jgi:hypothetical protein
MCRPPAPLRIKRGAKHTETAPPLQCRASRAYRAAAPLRVLVQLEPTDLIAVHLTGSVGEPDRPRLCVGVREIVIAQARSAVCLDRPVDDLAGRVCGGGLDHGDLGAGRLVAHRVHEPGGLVHQEPRLIDADPRLGEALERHRLLGDRAAEGNARLDPLAHFLQRPLGDLDESHGVMNPPGPQASLRNLKSPPLPEQQVLRRHAHVLEHDFHVTVGRIIEAKYRQAPQDGDTCGVARHENHRLLLVRRRARVGLA